ncbi:MAG: inner membrane CreD family protein, partial [Pseudomonas sp.]|nr:inner membrane CreD family protein [Pseudomonas sp.]
IAQAAGVVLHARVGPRLQHLDDLGPDNGNGWFDPATGTLHFVVATQCPFEVAQECVHMIKPSRFGLKHLNMHPGYTVGYGSKDNNIFVFYAAVAALYGAGVPIRLANDRYEQFQSGIKRHPFDIRYQLAVDKKDMSFKIFRADMSVDGGGRINYSPSVAAVGATAAQSIYYMPQNDLSVTAYHSRGVEAGSMRGYGTLQSMAATEMMVDEIADRLGVDAIELRRKNALKSGMKNTQGAVPAGALRLHEILDKAAAHDWWKNRQARKQAEDAKDHDNWYGVGFAAGLAALYAMLYGLLSAEDYALLMGSLLCFGLLGVFMVLTRRLDWSRVGRGV